MQSSSNQHHQGDNGQLPSPHSSVVTQGYPGQIISSNEPSSGSANRNHLSPQANAHPGSQETWNRYKSAYGFAYNTPPTTPFTLSYPVMASTQSSPGPSPRSLTSSVESSDMPDGRLNPAFPGNTHVVADPQTAERLRVGTESVRRVSEQRRVRDAAFTCGFPGCGANFTARHNLKAHEDSHTGNRNYVCACGVSFMRSTDMNRHQLKSCPLTRKSE